jgi:recombination protein RecT
MAEKTQAVEKKKLTSSERFANEVAKQFEAEAGTPMAFTDYEKTLAQHLFLKIDAVLKEFEVKRLQQGKNDKAPYMWENINMRKLAIDAVHSYSLDWMP